MRKICISVFVACLAIFVCGGPAFAGQWGEVREATLNLNVREKRTPKSEHVVTLAKGQRVKVDFQRDGWVAIFNLNETKRDEGRAIGYANVKYLKLIKAKSASQVPPSAQKTAAAPTPAPVQQPVEAAPAPKSKTGDGALKGAVKETPPPDPIKVGIDPSRIPVKITSDRMVYDENGKVVSFVGNVVAEHGQLTLWADNLSAYFSSKTGKKFSADSVDRIIAKGNVRAKRGKTEGHCGRLTYYVSQQLLKMEDNPKLQDGPNSLTGEIINFHVRENRSEVVGGKQRVKAIFLTPQKLKVQ